MEQRKPDEKRERKGVSRSLSEAASSSLSATTRASSLSPRKTERSKSGNLTRPQSVSPRKSSRVKSFVLQNDDASRSTSTSMQSNSTHSCPSHSGLRKSYKSGSLQGSSDHSNTSRSRSSFREPYQVAPPPFATPCFMGKGVVDVDDDDQSLSDVEAACDRSIGDCSWGNLSVGRYGGNNNNVQGPAEQTPSCCTTSNSSWGTLNSSWNADSQSLGSGSTPQCMSQHIINSTLAVMVSNDFDDEDDDDESDYEFGEDDHIFQKPSVLAL